LISGIRIDKAMANQVKLSARPRLEAGRNAVRKVRARGAVPAVLYGARDVARNLEVDRKDIEDLLSRAVGENILVELEISDGAKTTNRTSLIQEVQHHPVQGGIIHIDFYAVSMTEEIEAEIVLESEGEPIGVKTFNGLLQQSMRSLPVQCLPQNLPEIIVVDVSGLNIGDSLHVRDIKLPRGVTALADEDLTVFLVSEPTVVEEPTVAIEEEAAAPEVIKEKKPETPEAAAEPAK
jgi:large subunit ribosomal protein L25